MTRTSSRKKLPARLSHVDARGRVKMVDVGEKPVSERTAVAQAVVRMRPSTLRMIQRGHVAKGDVVATARLAGIMAAKRTSELIPLCHPLALDVVTVECTARGRNALLIEARAKVSGRTGVEMEALTAASIAALTIYDMCKAVDRAMTITDVCLIEKRGGRSGTYRRGS